jgi:type III secretion protein R
VGAEIYTALEPELAATTSTETMSGPGARTVLRGIELSMPPLKTFLARHAHPKEVELFLHWARKMGPESWREMPADHFLVLLPAFAVSELTEAFAIGFLLFLPFLVIDMVVSNILLAMGMHMLSPVVVSLPFKLLLFIILDGWSLLARGLLQGYL